MDILIIPIIVGILTLTLLGFLFGFGLAFIAQIFKVKVDPRVEQVIEALPGINCGACGYPGCTGYADAIVNKDVEINLCSPGGGDVIARIGEILGKTAAVKEKMVAKVLCLGDDAIAKKDYTFNGEEDCLTVYNFFQGEKSCKYSCIGKGNCIRVCPVDAIKRDHYNRVWINSDICIGCEKCVTVCPTHVIKMVPLEGGHFVACSSHYNGKTVREICKKGCIACKICEKLTPSDNRIVVENNLAIVNYKSNTDLEPAALKCPAHVIVPIKTQEAFLVQTLQKEKELALKKEQAKKAAEEKKAQEKAEKS
ncbi:MAG: RnfABCDGE type electron transport complex subunit B [Spirochaetes bacterium]|nr:RnfABCDGE type electron transport complex subunit B [Spirochaetota bacterium]